MVISKEAVDALVHFEGFAHTPYKCPRGIWTIGYGSTKMPHGKVTAETNFITRQEAYDIKEWHFKNHVYPHMEGLNLTQSQFDAVAILIYNIGGGAFASSSVKRVIKQNHNKMWAKSQLKALADAWIKWNKVRNPETGEMEVSNGLLRRRLFEFVYFLDGKIQYYTQEPEMYYNYLFEVGKAMYENVERTGAIKKAP